MQETRSNCFGRKEREIHSDIRAYLFLPDEGLCDIFSTRKKCCEFPACDVVILQNNIINPT